MSERHRPSEPDTEITAPLRRVPPVGPSTDRRVWPPGPVAQPYEQVAQPYPVERPRRRRGRRVLLGVAVIPLLAAAIGIPVADWLGHVRELDETSQDTVLPVPAGRPAVLYDVEWQVNFAALEDPATSPPPGTQTLRMDVAMTPLTAEGAERDTPPEFELRHTDDGRKWLAEAAERPVETELQAGATYAYVVVGRVPGDAPGHLALAVRPSDLIPYDGPIGDDFMKKMAEDAERARTDQVLLFHQR